MTDEAKKKIEEKYPLIGEASDVKWCLNYRGRIAAEFGYQLAQEELNKAFREGAEQGYREATSKEPYNEPTQDELWEELARNNFYYGGVYIEEVKKRYRVTRVK